jgi:hypothetical protein
MVRSSKCGTPRKPESASYQLRFRDANVEASQALTHMSCREVGRFGRQRFEWLLSQAFVHSQAKRTAFPRR